MKKTVRQITDALPELNGNVDVEIAADTLDDLQDIAAMAKTRGADLLVWKHQKEFGSDLNTLISMVKRDHTHIELISVIVRMEASLKIIQELQNAQDNVDLQQDLVDQIIKASL